MIPHTAPSVHSPARPVRLVVWLRCRQCQRGYFAAGAPGPHACPACAGGRLQPVGIWDLRLEAAPAGMLRKASDTAAASTLIDRLKWEGVQP